MSGNHPDFGQNTGMAKKPKTQTLKTEGKAEEGYCCSFPFSKVYQFKVTLRNTEPPVWRRIQVPNCYTFWDLHCAIIDAFGWLDCHMHLFTVKNPKSNEEEYFGITPDVDDSKQDGNGILPSWLTKISRCFALKPIENVAAKYHYDFGDDWFHAVVLEKIIAKKKGTTYPCCIDGENACPPEDCGGPLGYQHFKKVISYHNAPDHDEMMERVGGWFDPEWFEIGLVKFENPFKRWDVAILEKPFPKGMRMVQYHQMRKVWV